MNINEALGKLNELLPLVSRQHALPLAHRSIHQKILYSLANHGAIDFPVESHILESLENNDLVVLDKDTKRVIGAYPFSLNKTEHQVFNEDINFYAMCAFDAVAIAPVFELNINIKSRCHVTHNEIKIQQHCNEVIELYPSKDIYIGILWQSAGSCAADSLCTKMIFLKDHETAQSWKAGSASKSIFPVNNAIDFAIQYFKPLLQV